MRSVLVFVRMLTEPGGRRGLFSLQWDSLSCFASSKLLLSVCAYIQAAHSDTVNNSKIVNFGFKCTHICKSLQMLYKGLYAVLEKKNLILFSFTCLLLFIRTAWTQPTPPIDMHIHMLSFSSNTHITPLTTCVSMTTDWARPFHFFSLRGWGLVVCV